MDANPEAFDVGPVLQDLVERISQLETGADHMAAPFGTSPKIDKIAEALAKARAEFEAVRKTKTAKIKGRSKSGKDFEMSYSYADLGDVLSAITPALSKHGITPLQAPVRDGNGITIVTMLLHSSGQWIRSNLWMPGGDGKPQSVGSSITYGRRYALSPMVGVASEDDDDGAHASRTHEDRPRETQRRKPEPQGNVDDGASRLAAARQALKVMVEHKGKGLSAKGVAWEPIPLISAAFGDYWPGREKAQIEDYQKAIEGLKGMGIEDLKTEIAGYMPKPYAGDDDPERSIAAMGADLLENAKGAG